jgi:alpha-mannosidase
MHSPPERTRKRLEQVANVLKSKIYSERRPVDELLVSGATERISYKEAQTLTYEPAALGQQFGPLWATFWFRGKSMVPPEWSRKRIDLIFVSHYCESTLWMNGRVMQGLNFSFGERSEATLVSSAKTNQLLEFQIEMACNTAYGQWPAEKPYQNLSPYVLDNCEVGIFDPLAWEIYLDFLVLQQLESDIATTTDITNKAFGAELLSELNRFANEYDANDEATWESAHAILVKLLANENATLVHEITAVGEGHLDIAWWWPLAETWRKFIRTASNQVALMDEYPEYRFVCSQSYLYEDLKLRMPDLYERVKKKIQGGQWVPVGGTWVEFDCNLPSGESLARQFLYGQRFFQKEFGFRAAECWLQDSFGYNGQLPQLMKLAHIQRFVTQKLLWGHLKPPHRLFTWEGLDGTKVLAHVPPNHTFSNSLTVAAVRKAAAEFTEDNHSARSLMSFGFGDGGGGPTRVMIEIIERLRDLQGAPKTIMRSPSEFFTMVEDDLKKEPPPLTVGELYFSRHRGTYTSQSATKKAMRLAEASLHDLEFVSAIAFKLGLKAYPEKELDRLWKVVLVNQHHDIVTGTSITSVHREAVLQLQEVSTYCRQLTAEALSAISVAGRKMFLAKQPSGQYAAVPQKKDALDKSVSLPRKHGSATATSIRELSATRFIPLNTIGFPRREVAVTPDGEVVLIDAAAYAIGKTLSGDINFAHVRVHEKSGRIYLENEHLLAEFSSAGDLISLLDKAAKRETLSSGGNRLELYDDHPLDYDAWEIEPFHLETLEHCQAAHSYKTRGSALRAEIIFARNIGSDSHMVQTVRLEAHSRRLEFHCEVEWQERHKLLKVLFPVAVRANHATYETQFGAIERPTHFNTPEDKALFEVPGQKWADLSEHGYGVALLSDCKYGYSIHNCEMRLSLLRSPTSPDPHADKGRHEFAYALMPHQGQWQEGQVVAEAFKFNVPIVWMEGTNLPAQTIAFANISDPNIVLNTIKKAEDSEAIIVRLYECHGARGTAKLKFGFLFTTARLTDILENRGSLLTIEDGVVHVPYRPFEIISLSLA